MNSISTVLAVLLVVARSCPLIEDRFCCDGEEFVNDCFVTAAGKDLTLCQHNECVLFKYIKKNERNTFLFK